MRDALDRWYEACKTELTRRGQEHVLRWWGELTAAEREHLLSEIEAIPWDVLDPIIPTHVLRCPEPAAPADLEPAPVYPVDPRPEQVSLYEQAREEGRRLIAAGKVAAFTVAGGQGTRLGFDGPKGMIKITPVRGKSLFQLFAETVLAVRERYDVAIPWYIMTSPANHEQTVGFLRDHEFFGLPEGDVVLFSQGMLPAFDFEGKLLLEAKHRLALAPDGHGGSLKALVKSGALADMRKRGIGIISFFQVDNPLVKPFDPLFLGLHAKTGSEMSLKVTRKRDDLEPVGNICLRDGKLAVVEYMELPDVAAHARNADGTRRLDAANLAIHLLTVPFANRIATAGLRLPFKRAERKAAFVDAAGVVREPTEPNAVKLETFVFDALSLARRTLVLEVDRAEEFSPVKNATGPDSIETAIVDQVTRVYRWLGASGVLPPAERSMVPEVSIEMAPTFALDRDDLRDDLAASLKPFSGRAVYLE